MILEEPSTILSPALGTFTFHHFVSVSISRSIKCRGVFSFERCRFTSHTIACSGCGGPDIAVPQFERPDELACDPFFTIWEDALGQLASHAPLIVFCHTPEGISLGGTREIVVKVRLV
jgi:hypothetical protein